MEGGSNGGGGDKGGVVEWQVREGDQPTSSGGDRNGTFEQQGYDGDRLRSRLVALGDLEEKEPEEESQGAIYDQESGHLLNIFPEEIWVMILDNIKDAKTMESLHYASPFFRSRLLPKRELYLFPAVWNILIKKFKENHSKDHSYNETKALKSSAEHHRHVRNCEDCDRRRRTKWYSGILKLRLVCRAWSTAVDQSLEDPVTRGATSSNDWTFNDLPALRLLEFYQHFINTHARSERTPFLGRHNVIINYTINERPFHHLLLSIILVDLGRHINSMSISDSYRQHFFLPAAYQNLRSFLSSMRNLKMLKIRSQTTITSSLVSDMFRGLLLETSLHPLPTLDKLQHLTCHGAPTPIFNEILRRSSHLQTLEMDQRWAIICPWSYTYNLRTFSFPNLQELSIKLYAGNELPHLGLPVALPSLQKLRLDFQPDYNIDFPSVFRIVGSMFGDTLTYLDIKLPKANEFHEKEIILKECGSLRLNLPKLVHLKLEMRNLSSFDFLLPMKRSLETLELITYHEVNNDKKKHLVKTLVRNQAIQMVGFTHRLLDSNIWRLFPKLKEVKISEAVNMRGTEHLADYLYTRGDWEEIQNH